MSNENLDSALPADASERQEESSFAEILSSFEQQHIPNHRGEKPFPEPLSQSVPIRSSLMSGGRLKVLWR